MKFCRLIPLLLLPLLATPTQAQEKFTPQLSHELLLDFAADDTDGNFIVHAPGLRDALFFTYLGAGGHTFNELGELLNLPASAPGEAVYANLSEPGVAERSLWIQEGYPWGKQVAANLQLNMPTVTQGFDFGPSSETRLVFRASYNLQLTWREPPLRTSVSPGYFLQYQEGKWGYEEKNIRYVGLIGHYLYHRDDFELTALGIPVGGGLTLFVIVPSRTDPWGIGSLWDSNDLKYLLQHLDSRKLQDIRSTMTPRLVEARLPLLSSWEAHATPSLPVYLGEGADYSMLYPEEGVYVQDIGQYASLWLSEVGLSLSSVTSLSMHLPAPPPGGGSYGVINIDTKIPVGLPTAPQPLPIEFAADQPHIMILADDELTRIQSIAIIRQIPLADQLSPEEALETKPSDWTVSTWFGWMHTARNVQNLRPWYYHATHGWIYLPENIQAGGTWWWDGALGWSFASATSPYIYSSTHGWLWYARGDAGSRMFYSYANADWWAEAQ